MERNMKSFKHIHRYKNIDLDNFMIKTVRKPKILIKDLTSINEKEEVQTNENEDGWFDNDKNTEKKEKKF